MDTEPTLVERIASSDARRIAIMGLTRGSGKTTTLGHLIRGLQERGRRVGIAAAGREEEDVEFTEVPRGISIPLRAGTIVATVASAMDRTGGAIEPIERTDVQTPGGNIVIARVVQDGDVEPVGPASAHELRHVVEAIGRHADGHILIEGSFNRRSFAAPGIADGLILAVGAAVAPETERIVASTRYYLDLFGLRQCDTRAAEVFASAEAEAAAVLLGPDGAILGGFPWRTGGQADRRFHRSGTGFSRLVVPRSIGDEFVIPFLREKRRFEIVVRDPMRIALSPVYYSAWKKLGGGIRVVHPVKVLAVSLNPTNPAGPDLPAEDFLRAFREGLPEVPSHDVIQEELAAQPRRRWFGLPGS